MLTVTQTSLAPQLRVCPACHTNSLHEAQRERVFHPHGQTLVIPLLTSVCEHCGAEATSSAQHDENLRRLAARKAHYGGLLMLEEILALRRRYGLTQQLASRIFGKGKIAFSRYESETTYPDASTTLLISLAIARPDMLKWLADQAGVEIPLWQARCEDAQRAAAAGNTPEVATTASPSVAAAPAAVAIPAPAAPAKQRARARPKAKETALP